MIRIDSNLKLPRTLGRPVVAIGTFDGVHLGHQRILDELAKWAKRLHAKSLVVTFAISPKRLTRGEHAPCIASMEHRLLLFEQSGIDACLLLKFTERLRLMPAREFVEKVLIRRLHVQGVLLGYNARFGRNAEGDFALLKQMESEGLLKARQVARPVTLRGKAVSSSAIREAIQTGRLKDAGRMLGRPFSLFGTIVHGRGRGTGIGFPTANLDLHHEAIPPSGVYLTEARLDRKWMPSVTSIGRQPTLPRPLRHDVVEVCIPGLNRDVYGRKLEVRFVRKLREQKKFGSKDELVAQIRRDMQAIDELKG